MDLVAQLVASPQTVTTASPTADASDGAAFAQSLSQADAQLQAGQTPEATAAARPAPGATSAASAVETTRTAASESPSAQPQAGDPSSATATLPSATTALTLAPSLPTPAAPVTPPPAAPQATQRPPQGLAAQAAETAEAQPEIALPEALPDTAPTSSDAATSDDQDSLQHIRQRMHLIDTAGTLDPTANAAQAYAALPAAAPVNVDSSATQTSLDTPRSTKLLATSSGASTAPAANVSASSDDASSSADDLTATAPVDAAAQAQAQAQADQHASGGSDQPSDSGHDTAVSATSSTPTWDPSTLLNATASSTTSTPATTLTATVGSQQWTADLGQQVLSLQQRGEKQVDLQLHPADLGPLSISLRLDGNTTQAQFSCAHPGVRSAVEQAIPQLREALASQGIALGQASVNDQPSRQAQGEQSWRNPQASGGTTSAANDDTAALDAPTGNVLSLSSRVDLYT